MWTLWQCGEEPLVHACRLAWTALRFVCFYQEEEAWIGSSGQLSGPGSSGEDSFLYSPFSRTFRFLQDSILKSDVGNTNKVHHCLGLSLSVEAPVGEVPGVEGKTL